jgi:hypothetical protein
VITHAAPANVEMTRCFLPYRRYRTSNQVSCNFSYVLEVYQIVSYAATGIIPSLLKYGLIHRAHVV